MSTKMGSSSTTNANRDLVFNITKMFESTKQQFSVGGLISVPDHHRKLDEQAFTPLLISIGPIHYSDATLQTMKKCKVLFCECFIQRANIDLQHLVCTIRLREKEIRSYYTETVVSSISSDDFVAMILVDGMFILECFLRKYSDSHLEEFLKKRKKEKNSPLEEFLKKEKGKSNSHLEEDNLTTIRIPEWVHPILQFDLVLLENQLPFFVLEMLFKQANFLVELEIKPISLTELAFDFFQCYNFQKRASPWNVQIEHFTDLVRFFYLSEKLLYRDAEGAKLSYTATQLHEAGVKFEVAKEYGRRFLDIRFDFNNGVLEIPCIKLNDEKIRLIRNIIALEQSLYVGEAYVTDFFVILDFLIDTSKDVDLLCDKGILVNYLGDSTAAASAFNNLNTNILRDYMNIEYSILCEDLNAFYKKRWHRWKATLWRQYFSTPWRAASTIAAIILLLLTTIQTACSLRSTTW